MPDKIADTIVIENGYAVHDSNQHSVIHSFMSWFSGVSAAISLTPFVLSAFDIGKAKEVRNIIDYNGACCTVIANKKPFWSKNYSFSSLPQGGIFNGLDGIEHTVQGPSYGVAGLVSSLLMKIPGVGYHLGTGELPEPLNAQLRKIPRMGHYIAELKLANALAAGGIIMLGELSGSALEKWEKERARKRAGQSCDAVAGAEHTAGAAGRAVSLGTKAVGLFIALPTILAGVGHAVQVTTATFGIDKVNDIEKPAGIGGHIMAFLGKPMGECGGQFKAPTAAATAGMVGLCCAVPAAIAAISTLLPHITPEKTPRIITMPKTKAPEALSIIHDDLGTVVNYHHSIPWERFEKESQELDSRIERLKVEVHRKESLGTVAKWTTRIAGIAAAFAGSFFLLKKSATQAAVSESLDTAAAQAAVSKFNDAKKAPSTMLHVNRADGVNPETYPILGEEGYNGYLSKITARLKALPDKVVFKRIRDTPMRDGDGVLKGCCIQPEHGCCGVPYYKKDVAEGLYNALNGVLSNISHHGTGDPMAQANRQLAFAGGLSVAVGACAWLGNKMEQAIVAKPKKQLEELLTRKKVIDGLKGHWWRDMMSDAHDMGGMQRR